MSLIQLYVFQYFFLKLNLIILFLSSFISIIIFYFNKLYFFQNFLKFKSFSKFLKLVLLLSLLVSFFFFLIYSYMYFIYISQLNYILLHNMYFYVPNFDIYFFNISIDIFGLIILFLAYFIGVISLLALDTRLYFKNIKYIYFIHVFILIVFFFVFSNNILLLFFFYELLLLPSFLIVYQISPSRRAIQASLYFIIWTQIGSFLVLCVISYIISVTGSFDYFFLKNYNFSDWEAYFLYLFLFLGFGFKVPIWPFHYWLTKTHVEAPTGFSMYLSGFLVKTALYGFYKLTNLLGNDLNSIFFTTIIILGILDASMKMWGQTDIKKLVAYCTIQEMNIIYLAFCWGDTYSIIGGIIFCITHGFLSGLMFYLVDCIQRRYSSRSVIEISGILTKTPSLGIAIILMCILYSGLPGTLKFTSEFYIFSGFFEYSPFLCFIVLFISNVIGLIGFSKSWFNIIFGMNSKPNSYKIMDLTNKEIYIIFICMFILVFSCFFVNILF